MIVSKTSNAISVQTDPIKNTEFFIVGVGASAGGLEALEQLFSLTLPCHQLAFVVISHLDPTHHSLLTEILQRKTTLSVETVQDNTTVLPDHIYVIPPNYDMSIMDGILQLSELAQPRAKRMPIDTFFNSLAKDQKRSAIGIVLSGTGTDGTLGLRSIIEVGGVALVQDPTTAKYDGMPISAINAGYASHVLPVAKMPAALLSCLRSFQCGHLSIDEANGLSRILLLLRNSTGHDFSQYKKNTIYRRVARRMSQHHIDNINLYAHYLNQHPAELKQLFKELLINVTSFFRDADAFNILKQEIFPQLFDNKEKDSTFRVWIPACATGEEAYSIAMLLHEFMEEKQLRFKVQIYATDLDDDAIAVARAGFYPLSIDQDVSAERLRLFFIKEEKGYRIKKFIREMVIFAVQNLISDPPFTKLDLLSCRNLMIYPIFNNHQKNTFRIIKL